MHWSWLPWLRDTEPPPRTYNVNVDLVDESPQPRLASVQDIDDWMTAADRREVQVFHEMEILLTELAAQWPRRVRAIRRELSWIRSEAANRELNWGKHPNDK